MNSNPNLRFLIFVVIAFLCSCSAHSPFIVKSTTDQVNLSTNKFPSHAHEVLVVRGPLPKEIKYESLANLDVGKTWYGSSQNVLQSLADGARQIGADAVINVETWHQPSGWSWAAPHGKGTAVKLEDPSMLKTQLVQGEWK